MAPWRQIDNRQPRVSECDAGGRITPDAGIIRSTMV